MPWPILEDHGVPIEALLGPIFTASLTRDRDDLVSAAGTLLYRFYEGCSRYGDAARVITAMLARAKRRGNRFEEAVLTNNLGYEALLERDWPRAEPFFARAVELFSEIGATFDEANSQANLLASRFERTDGEPPEGFEHEVSSCERPLQVTGAAGRSRACWPASPSGAGIWRMPLVSRGRQLRHARTFRAGIGWRTRSISSGWREAEFCRRLWS